MPPTLILTPRALVDAELLAQAAAAAGWEVVRLSSWRVPIGMHPDQPVIYGEPLFAEIVAAALDLALIQAPADWLAHVPSRWLSRSVRALTLAEARQQPGPLFIKPADAKSFPARVYASGAELPLADLLPADTLTLVSEPVDWEVEYRCVIVGRAVLTLSPYWRAGASAQHPDGSWPTLDMELAEATTFLAGLLADGTLALAPAFVLDIGRIAGRGWAIVEANSIWGAGIYGGTPSQVLAALCRAAIPRAALTASDAIWARSAIELEDEPQQLMQPDADGLVTLYRPVGERELVLIAEADYRAFPPRLPEQPIFYPVLNERYASEIARGWNTNDPASGHVGYVTRFRIRAEAIAQYPVQVAGAPYHQELWVPAEQLGAFNDRIVGPIEVIATYQPADSGL